MKGSGPSVDQQTRYLLGLLSEEEREALEADYFTTDESFEHLLAAEDDLFDDYAAGRLPPVQQAAFRRRYLSSHEALERLAFARAFQQRTKDASAAAARAPQGSGASSRERWLALAAVLVMAIAAVWLARENAGLKKQVGRLQAERREAAAPAPEHAGVPTGEADLPAAGWRTASPEVLVGLPPASVPVDPGVLDVRVSRAQPAEPVELAITQQTQSVRLQVMPPQDDPAASYGVVIRGPDGREVWRKDGLVPERAGEALTVEVPAAVLTEAENVLSVETEGSGGAPSAVPREDYRLRVLRKVRRPPGSPDPL